MSQGVVCGVLPVIAIAAPREQKRIEQTERRNGRISILGVWQPEQRFKYALACGSFKSESYIKVIDWIAEQTSETFRTTGRMTVVVKDNGSLHKSQRVWSKLVGERVVLKPNRNMVVFVVLKKAYLLSISLGLILNQHE